jgi:hypothetical protein
MVSTHHEILRFPIKFTEVLVHVLLSLLVLYMHFFKVIANLRSIIIPNPAQRAVQPQISESSFGPDRLP